MKRTMFSGALAGAGMFLLVVAGARHPQLLWTDVAMIVGAAFTVVGALEVGRIIKEGIEDEKIYSERDCVRPFNLR